MEVLFASSNEHKVSEANRIGGDYGVEFARVDCPYPELQSDSLSEIAEEGAGFVYEKIKKPVIVEDSGLFINALKGFPGAYSAPVHKKIGNQGILRLLAEEKNRTACFVSAVAYAGEDGIRVFEGTVEGEIIFMERGSGGFGYDPIFKPRGREKTFAEDPEYKDKVSHRYLAVKEFCEWITEKRR